MSSSETCNCTTEESSNTVNKDSNSVKDVEKENFRSRFVQTELNPEEETTSKTCNCTTEESSNTVNKDSNSVKDVEKENFRSRFVQTELNPEEETTSKTCNCTTEESSSEKCNCTTEENTSETCNCTTEESTSETCNCTTEESSHTINKDCNYEKNTEKEDFQSCFVTMEFSCDEENTSETCNCTTEESSNTINKDLSCEKNVEKEDLQSCYIVLELTESASNLKASKRPDESSPPCDHYTVIDCSLKSGIKTSEEHDSCPCSNKSKDSGKSCDCTSEESLKSCICSETCSEKSVITVDSSIPTVLEDTLAIIKPECIIYRKEIEREIIDEGFKIINRRWLQLTPEQVADFYQDNLKKKNFARLVCYMSSGPIIVFVLSKYDAIRQWKFLIGPKTITKARQYAPDSIRAKYGMAGDDLKNCVHGSENQQAAEREITFFFPDLIKKPLMCEEESVEYLKKHVNDFLSYGLIKCCEQKPSDPITWLGNWLLENNPNKPKYLLHYKSNLYD